MGVEAIVETKCGKNRPGGVKEGISVGSHEVWFTYDGGTRWGGVGVEGGSQV
jgi:enolase